ncbi:MAG: GH3 auxin-responsive promoter family protein [Alteromonadales bacterium]|nr:GH3 auxin-responsive promoter family protein [Alteromonadales bacterium]
MINITAIAKYFFKFRSKQLKKQNVQAIQQRQLFKLISQAKSTTFGIQHSFKEIKSLEDYQRLVPLRNYDDFWNEFWSKPFPELIDCTWPGKIEFFALSSGTTSDKLKYIPVSKPMRKSNAKASIDLFCHHFENRPQSNILAGKGFMFAGLSGVTELSNGVCAGALPAILAKKTPQRLKPWYFPSASLELLNLKSFDEKISQLIPISLKENIHSLSSFPSWLLILFRKLHEGKGQDKEFRIKDYYPNLEMIVHGGTSITPYLKRFSEYIKGSHCELREIYPSSEGFIAIADRGTGEGLRLICDHNIFYEFVPVDELEDETPNYYWLGNVKVGIHYVLVITTCSGLWRYVLGDIVKFVDVNPPRLLVVGRTASKISIAGEHLIEEQISHAVSVASEAIKATLIDFTVGLFHPQEISDRGRYIFIVEFQKAPKAEEVLHFSQLVDDSLCESNAMYKNIKLDQYGLDIPEIIVAAPHTFNRWLEANQKHKVPHVIANTEKFSAFLKFSQEMNH